MASSRGLSTTPEQCLEMTEKLFQRLENEAEFNSIWCKFIANEKQYNIFTKTPHDHISLTIVAFLISVKGGKKYKLKHIFDILNLLIAYFEDQQGHDEWVVRFPGRGSTTHERIPKKHYVYAYCSERIYPFLEEMRLTIIKNSKHSSDKSLSTDELEMTTCGEFLWEVLRDCSYNEAQLSIKKSGTAIPTNPISM